jgi:hypothetical protein
MCVLKMLQPLRMMSSNAARWASAKPYRNIAETLWELRLSHPALPKFNARVNFIARVREHTCRYARTRGVALCFYPAAR